MLQLRQNFEHLFIISTVNCYKSAIIFLITCQCLIKLIIKIYNTGLIVLSPHYFLKGNTTVVG